MNNIVHRAAAGQGFAAAQYNLGTLYENGDGVPQDKSEAAKWYRAAAEQGDEDAQFNLLWKGSGVHSSPCFRTFHSTA